MPKFVGVLGIVLLRAGHSRVGWLSHSPGRETVPGRAEIADGAVGTHHTHLCSCGREEKRRSRGEGAKATACASDFTSRLQPCFVPCVSCRAAPPQGSLHLRVQYKPVCPK